MQRFVADDGLGWARALIWVCLPLTLVWAALAVGFILILRT